MFKLIIITWGNQYENSSRGPEPAALIKFWCVTETVVKIVGNYNIYRVIRVHMQKEDRKDCPEPQLNICKSMDVCVLVNMHNLLANKGVETYRTVGYSTG